MLFKRNIGAQIYFKGDENDATAVIICSYRNAHEIRKSEFIEYIPNVSLCRFRKCLDYRFTIAEGGCTSLPGF